MWERHCKQVMEHFLHCITDFISSCAIHCAHISPFPLSNFFFQICLCTPHPCLLITVFSFCLTASLLCFSLRSSNVNPLQGSAVWSLAKRHPCYPECTGAGQGNIYLQCDQLFGPWQVGMMVVEINIDELSWMPSFSLDHHNMHYNHLCLHRHIVSHSLKKNRTVFTSCHYTTTCFSVSY